MTNTDVWMNSHMKFTSYMMNGAVIGITDGHVEFIRSAKYYPLLADPSKNELWCYPGSANGRR